MEMTFVRTAIISCFILLGINGCTTNEGAEPAQAIDETIPPPPMHQQGIEEKNLPPIDQPASEMITEPMQRTLPPSPNKAVSNLLSKAREAFNEGKWDLALSHIERAYRIDSDDPNVLITKAILLYKQGKFSEAENWALKSLRQIPKDGLIQQLTAWEIIAAARIELNKPNDLTSEAESKVLQLQDALN